MMLKTSDGIEFEVSEFGPETAKSGVLIIHDWWGVLDYNWEWAQRLAAEGYRTLVIDLYDGERARSAEQAGEMMRTLDQEIADTKLLAAIKHLKQEGRKLASLGWSFGGRQALQAALLDPDAVVATVMYYCRMLNDVEQLQQLNGPVLAIYSETEKSWPEKMDRFTEAMAEAGRKVESHSFNAGHGFVNPGSERYNEEVAEQSWQLVRDFFARNLR
ncbi:MAG TPA: alpha/beta fold hydrolase [Gammaproteobacteria bacterium]